MKIAYQLATAWMLTFGTLAALLLIAGVVGMAMWPNSSISPGEYPAHFAVLAIAALAIALPGWIVSMALMGKRKP